jgi:hypothetical protein
VERDRVDRDRVTEEVEELAVASGGVGAGEPAGVVERSVDGFGVAASRVEVLVFGVGGWDGA